MLILERPWTRQPPAGTKAAPGWTRVYDWRGYDVANNGARLSPGTQTYLAGSAGMSLKVNASKQVSTNELIPGISSGITAVFIAQKFGQISSSDFLLGEHNADSGAYNWGWYESASNGNLVFFIHNGSSGVATSLIDTSWSTQTAPSVFIATYGDGDNNVRLYRNGVQQSSAVQTGNIQRNATAYLRCCFWQDGVPNFAIYGAAILNKRMSSAEIAARFGSISAAYGSLFAPLRIYIPTATAAASAPTITALSARLITATSAQPRISYS